MQSTSGCSSSNGFDRINQFALVSYIPDPLGSFLDALRLHLVPKCKPHAHVTVLPPRPLCGTQEQAILNVERFSEQFAPFSIRLGDVSKFDHSDVIYIELASGRDELEAMYNVMNCGPCSYSEKFRYCPHITLAQNLPKEQVERTFADAIAAWKAYPFERSFRVETLCFVQNTTVDRWIDLQAVALDRPAPADLFVTQKDLVEPLHRA